MKKLFMFFLLFVSCNLVYAEESFIVINKSAAKTDTNCDQTKYYTIGILCQDTDDGKLYKGTGSAVEEISGTGESATYENINTNGDIDTDLTNGATASTVPSSAATLAYADTKIAAKNSTFATDSDPDTIITSDGYDFENIQITVGTADDEVRLSEVDDSTGAVDDGKIVKLFNADATGTDYFDFCDIDGQQDLPGDPTECLKVYPGDYIEMQYKNSGWRQVSRSLTEEQIASFLTVETEPIPVEYMKDGAVTPGDVTVEDNISYANFADDADNDVEFAWVAPADLSGTTIKVRVISVVTNATAPADTEGVSWAISACSSGTSDTHDCTLGTEANSEDADLDNDANAQWDYAVFPYVEVTPTDLAAGEVVKINVKRDTADADDDYAQDIGLVMVEIKYKRTHATAF